MGGGGRLHVTCVPMREQKNDEKGYFFETGSAQRCHHLGWEKFYFCRKRVCFLQFCKGCRSKRVLGVLINYIGKGYFLNGHGKKEYHFQNVGHTV